MAAFFKDKQGNIFTGVKPGQAVPQGFNEIHANTTDAAVEKHVPKVELQHDGHIIRVQVGETEHPMTEEHFIEWVALETEDRVEVHELKPDQQPVTFFAGGAKKGTVYAYCNLHGLWKAEF